MIFSIGNEFYRGTDASVDGSLLVLRFDSMSSLFWINISTEVIGFLFADFLWFSFPIFFFLQIYFWNDLVVLFVDSCLFEMPHLC